MTNPEALAGLEKRIDACLDEAKSLAVAPTLVRHYEALGSVIEQLILIRGRIGSPILADRTKVRTDLGVSIMFLHIDFPPIVRHLRDLVDELEAFWFDNFVPEEARQKQLAWRAEVKRMLGGSSE